MRCRQCLDEKVGWYESVLLQLRFLNAIWRVDMLPRLASVSYNT